MPRPIVRLALGLPIAAALTAALFRRPDTALQHGFLAILVLTPVLVIAVGPELWGRRREVLLGVGAFALCCAAVKLFEEPLVRRMVPAAYALDTDHRVTDCDLCPNSDGVAMREERPVSADDFNIVFLGDSFAEGEGLEDKLEAFPFVVDLVVVATAAGRRLPGGLGEETVWRDDPHYNEVGHRIAADAVVDILTREGLSGPR